MHTTAFLSTLLFFEFLYDYLLLNSPHLSTSNPLKVLDIGSADFNGNNFDAIRETSIYANPQINLEYVGLDMESGFNVDVVRDPDADKIWEIDNTFDVIISSNCFEHDDFFWETFMKMVAATKSGGFILLVVPSDVPVHRYPVDNWRFYPDAGNALARYGRKRGESVHCVYSDVPESGFDQISIIWKADSVNMLQSAVDTRVLGLKIAFQHFGLSLVANMIKYGQIPMTNAQPPLNFEWLQMKMDQRLAVVPTKEAQVISASILRNCFTAGDGSVETLSVLHKYHIQSHSLLLKIDVYYLTNIMCRKDIGTQHPVVNALKPHRKVDVTMLGSKCPLSLTLLLTEDDLVDDNSLFKTLTIVSHIYQIDSTALYNEIQRDKSNILKGSLFPVAFARSEEIKSYQARNVTLDIPYDVQKIMNYMFPLGLPPEKSNAMAH